MKVIIAGSRDASAEAVRRALETCPWTDLVTTVVSGMAAGADREGELWASERGLAVERFPADWKTFGKRAGPVRNKEMSENADGLIAVWDGNSRGTANMIELAQKRGLRVFVYRTDGTEALDVPAAGEVAARWKLSEATIAGTRSGPTPSFNRNPERSPSRVQTQGRYGRPDGNAPPKSNVHYRLNAVLAAFPVQATVSVGRVPYVDRTQLEALRERLWGSHFVKRFRESIEVVAFASGSELIGEHRQVRLTERPDLAQNLLREWLARCLARYRTWRGRGGVISYVSERRESNLLIESLAPGVELPDGIGHRIGADFDVRQIKGSSGQTRLVIAVDVKTRITIDCTIAALQGIGFDPVGFCVKYEVQTPRGPSRRYAGLVRSVVGDMLLLEDHEEGLPSLPTSQAWLEPRRENLERLVHLIAGPHGDGILDRLHIRVAERVGGAARPALVDDWVAALHRFPSDVAQGVRVRLDGSVMHADGDRFPTYEVYDKPRLVFDVGRTKTETWNQGGLDKHGPYNFERFAPRRLNIVVVCQSSKQGEVERFVQQLLDGIPGSKWAEKGFVRRYQLDRPSIRTFTTRSPTARHYREAVAAAIDDATTRNERWSLALIQTEESFHALKGDENPYLLTKALFLTHQVPTQAFEWESIKPGAQIDAIVNNIGLAIYAKVNGIPWLLPVHQTVSHELIIGIGSFEASESRLGGREKYIGVTTVFNADGRYILESRTPATPAADYLPVLLAALERVVTEVRKREGWTDDQTVRFIFHVFKDFNQREIDAVKGLMNGLRLPHAEFAFVHIVQDHPFMVFDPTEAGIGYGQRKGVAAAPRGLRVDLSQNEVLICLKGPREVRQWSDGIPKPMLLRLHRDSTFRDLSYLSRQVFDFTCLSWRTLFPSPLPISVLYSDLVARNLLQLRDVSIWSPEAILGPVGRGRWFL